MTRQGAFRAAVAGVLGMAPMTLLAQGLWAQKADMPTARFGLTATVVDGRGYAIGGGIYRGGMVRSVQEYDPATDTWVDKANMPTSTCWHSTSAVDGKVYAIGGWSEFGGIGTVLEYDPETDTWAAKAPMPTTEYREQSMVSTSTLIW